MRPLFDDVWGVVFYEPPPRWKQWLARIIPWYKPQDQILGASTKVGDYGSVWDSDSDTVRVKWFADGRFILEDDDDEVPK